MRLGVISDIHGNSVALDAVLADLSRQGIDRIICLGDAIQGGPQPVEVVARLRELGCPVVMGNADAWLLSGVETGYEQISPERRIRLNVTREWSLERLSADDKAFIETFQPTVTVTLPGGRALLGFHGSPDSFDEFILPSTAEEDFQRFLMPYAGHILCGGHMHLQFIRRIGDSFFFNPGSVGVCYNHQQSESNFRLDPWAEYAILSVDGPRRSLQFHRVPIDVERLIQVYLKSGQPYAEQSIARYEGRS